MIRDFTGGASEYDLREYEYSVADRLQRIVRDGTETRFFYGASREKRIKRIDSADGVYWTFYVGSTEITHSESELDVSGYQHVTSGRVQRHVAGVLIVDKEFRSSIYAFSYLHKNHQGSIVAISDGLGNVVDHMRYDAWGARRDVDRVHLQPPVWSAGLDPFVAQFTAYTHKGYTGHEHVDQAGIIHMEGRIYDPILGRFLQADPLIEDVGTLNRYTYVHNNPLAFVDPNGFFSIGNLLTGALAIAISVVTGFAAAGIWATNMAASITVAAVGGAAAGFVATGTGEGALFGAFTAVAALGVSQYLSDQPWAFDSGSFTTEGNIARSVGVGLSSGISSDLQGGKFGHGFFTAGVSSLVSPAISDISDSDYLNAFGASLVGGTLSKATGGKFANGAATGAFQYAVAQSISGKSASQPNAGVGGSGAGGENGWHPPLLPPAEVPYALTFDDGINYMFYKVADIWTAHATEFYAGHGIHLNFTRTSISANPNALVVNIVGMTERSRVTDTWLGRVSHMDIRWSASGAVFTHEVGHAFGLKDRYSDTPFGSVPEDGYRGNMMADFGPSLTPQQISVIRQNVAGGWDPRLEQKNW